MTGVALVASGERFSSRRDPPANQINLAGQFDRQRKLNPLYRNWLSARSASMFFSIAKDFS